jgi:hypothetical protein
MAVAAVVFQEQGIADVVERRAVLAGRQRPAGGAGDLLKIHGSSFSATPAGFPATCKPLKNLYE